MSRQTVQLDRSDRSYRRPELTRTQAMSLSLSIIPSDWRTVTCPVGSSGFVKSLRTDTTVRDRCRILWPFGRQDEAALHPWDVSISTFRRLSPKHQTDINRSEKQMHRSGLLDRFCAAQLRFRPRFLLRFSELCEVLEESDRDRSGNAEIVRCVWCGCLSTSHWGICTSQFERKLARGGPGRVVFYWAAVYSGCGPLR